MSTLGERIRYARESKGYLQNDLAKLIGVKSSGVISNWEKDLNKPDAEKIVKLCDVLDVSASFLLDYYGKSSFELSLVEEEHIKKYRSLDSAGRDHVDTVLQWETDRMKQLESSKIPAVKMINYYYRLASAGTGQIVFDMPPTRSIEIPDIPEYKKADYAIGVNGSSMEPTYHDGDILLVEMTDHIDIGEIGIFLVDGQSYVKQRGRTELISLNEDHENVPLTPDSRCMGRVIAKLES